MITFVDDDELEGRTITFELPRDDEEPWVLEDSEITRLVHLIRYQTGRLVDSIPVDQLCASTLLWNSWGSKGDLKKLLVVL